MKKKKPLNEGNARGSTKGGRVVNQQNKPRVKPIAPPPAPKPKPSQKTDSKE